jgi:hypothetical protein
MTKQCIRGCVSATKTAWIIQLVIAPVTASLVTDAMDHVKVRHMNLLIPGYIPEGWTRGTALTIWKARPGYRGAVFQNFTNYSPDAVIPAIAAIEFHYDDHPEVEEWLKWWQSKT